MVSLPMNWRKFKERYNLKGNLCKTCGTAYFPSETVCPNCRRKGELADKNMPRQGKIVSFTKVSAGPEGFETEVPYFLAIIELDNGVKILSQIVDSDEEKITIGAKVKKVFRKISDKDPKDIIAYGYKFTVTE